MARKRYTAEEIIGRKLRQWLTALQVTPLYIEPGSPWENGYCESFNGSAISFSTGNCSTR